MWQWCIHHMKWMVHKTEDCDLGKKQDQQVIENQNNQWEVWASQATYAEMQAKLAQLSIDK